MRKLSACVVLLCTWMFLAPKAFGWIDTGHKIVAMIAWDQLPPATREKLTEILKAHPRYEQDLLQDLPAGASDEEKARYAFAMAATWPDMIRSPGNPMHNLYHHPNWHYIDIPYSPDGTTPTTRPNNGKGPANILEALAKNLDDLKRADTTPADRAVALCWVLHLVGDIHQPLHAAEMFSKQFPNGDLGGNAEVVMRDPPYRTSAMNLHYIWDALPGDYKSMEPIVYLAQGLEKDSKFSRDAFKDQLAVTDFAKWADESHQLAVKWAYLNGKLAVAPKDSLKDSNTEIPGVPAGYIEDAEKVAFRQITLAGYRLGDLLK